MKNRVGQQRAVRRRTVDRGATLPTDPESLRARKEARHNLDLTETLLVVKQSSSTRTFERDFRQLSDKHPEITYLLLQLLAGAKRKYGKQLLSYTTFQDVYLGIEEFTLSITSTDSLDCSVRAVEDINVQIAKNFDAWLLKNYPKRTLNRKRFGKVRAIVEYLQKKHSDSPRMGKKFTWSAAPGNTEKVSQGYSISVFNLLTDACLEDIQFVMTTMKKFDGIVESEDRIVDREQCLEELIRTFGEREVSLDLLGKLNSSRPSEFENSIRKSVTVKKSVARWGMTMDEFVSAYRSRRDECMKTENAVFKMRIDGNGIISGYSAEDSYRVAMATAANNFPDWPLNMEYKAANDLFSFNTMILKNEDKPTSINRKTYRILYRMRLGYQPIPIEVGLMAYFANQYFTADTLYPFFLYVQMNTGWNEEVVVSMTDCLDDHVEPDILDPDYTVIYGSKERVGRAQGCRSSKKNPLSVYSVLRFIESSLTKHRNAKNYVPNTLWQFVVNKNLWNKYERVVTALDNGNIGSISNGFLKRHQIVVDPKKKTQRIEAKRVRTTYETRRKEQELSLEEISALMGHEDIDTTDQHYNSDHGSIEIKNKRIRELQIRLLDDIKNYSARLVSSKTLAELREAIGDGDIRGKDAPKISDAAEKLGVSPEEVIYLLSPKGQTYISICINRLAPTWPSARLFVPKGEDCTFFNKCCLCQQSLIFKEALPYIARRIRDLSQLQLSIPAQEWAANYSDEAAAWEQILHDWQPEKEVETAKLASYDQEFVLPLTMRGA